MIGAVAAWVATHRVVDLALQGALIALSLVTMLGCVCIGAYLVLMVRRLTSKANWETFPSLPIPAVLGGKFWGAEINFGAIQQALAVTEQAATDSMESAEELERRVVMLEEAMRLVNVRVHRMEDIHGTLLKSGVSDE